MARIGTNVAAQTVTVDNKDPAFLSNLNKQVRYVPG